MTQKANLEILFPPARMVWGDVYKARTEDMDGRPLVYKSGADIGKPRGDFAFGIAIPKQGETHWAYTEWGKKIWEFGHAQWPQGQAQRQDFAWKIDDGDSTVPNKRNRKPCDNPGYPGHWIVKPSSSIAPRLYKTGPNGPVKYDDVDAIKPGDWIEVYVVIASNETLANPGLYINHSMVCFRAYDKDGRIVFGPDPGAVGFGAATLGASATNVPVGGQSALAPSQPAAPGAPPIPGQPVAPGAPPAGPQPPTVATANPPAYSPPGLAQPPAPGAPLLPAAPQAPAAPAGPVMLPAAQGIPYEQYIAKGWTDQLLRQHGYMQ